MAASTSGPGIPIKNDCPTFCRNGRERSSSIIKAAKNQKSEFTSQSPFIKVIRERRFLLRQGS